MQRGFRQSGFRANQAQQRAAATQRKRGARSGTTCSCGGQQAATPKRERPPSEARPTGGGMEGGNWTGNWQRTELPWLNV